MSPEPPQNVQLVMPDGTSVPLELTYEGTADDGTELWLAVTTSPALREGCFLTADRIPANTTIVLPLRPGCELDADGRCLTHSAAQCPQPEE